MMIYPWLSIFDLQTLYSNIKKPLKCTEKTFDDYKIIVPVFGKPSYLKNLDFLRTCRDRVIIASISDQSEEMEQLLAALRREGFQVSILDLHKSVSRTAAISSPASFFHVFVKFNVMVFKIWPPWTVAYDERLHQSRLSSRPGPVPYYAVMKHPLESCVYDAMRKTTVEYVKEKYVCFLDGDSIPQGDFGKPCAVLEREGLDIASVKVLPNSKANFIERMQWIEFNIAMRSRHYYPWLTSGACCIVKTSALKEIIRNHSLYFLGGDIEIGILGRLKGKKIGYIDFTVLTDVPNTFTKWFKQRIDWFCGSFRLSIINFDKHLTQPIFLIYMAGLVFLIWPLKLFGIFFDWWILPLVLLLYIPITFANWQVRDRYMFLYPLYGCFQCLILPPLGILRYLYLLFRYKMVGRISQNRYQKQKDADKAI